jgi:putative isomerase
MVYFGVHAWEQVKALITLYTNWRTPNGGLFHDGIYPSFASYMGFWSWDSWKHAVALAPIDPWLAQSSIRAMFDFQGNSSFYHGMICDVVFAWYTDAWTNTKPPLASWAVWHVAKALEGSQGTLYLTSMYPKLMRMHQWWYQFRDVDHNEVCEFGANNAGVDQARGESGMDNAVRFDNMTLLGPKGGAQSADRESIDLNSHLYADKLTLAAIADRIGRPDEASKLRTAAAALRTYLMAEFFNASAGFFFDRMIANKHLQTISPGCEGFTPLWARVASPEQADHMVNVLLSPQVFLFAKRVPCVPLSCSSPTACVCVCMCVYVCVLGSGNGVGVQHFGTTVPFPSFSVSDPKFDANGTSQIHF